MASIADPVVASASVVMHHDLDGRLHMLQYPLRPATRPPPTPTSVRLRVKHSTFEVEHGIPTDSGHFDHRADSDPRMRRARFLSSPVPPKAVHALALLSPTSHGNMALHLHPVQSTALLRPELSYLDPAPASTGPSSAPTRVMRHLKKNDERSAASRRSSYAFHRSAQEKDAWVKLTPFGPHEEYSEKLRGILGGGDGAGEFKLDAHDEAYLDACVVGSTSTYLRAMAGGFGVQATANHVLSVAPPDTHPTSMLPASATAKEAGKLKFPIPSPIPLSLTDVASRGLSTLVEDILRRAIVLPFVRILELCTAGHARVEGEVTVMEVRAAVEEHAVLVRGNWVLNSETYFGSHWLVAESPPPPATSAKISAMEARQAQLKRGVVPLKKEVVNLLVALRDILLHELAVNAVVYADAIATEWGYALPLINKLLAHVAERTTGTHEWRFKLPRDADFEKFLPRLADAQAVVWETRVAAAQAALRKHAANAQSVTTVVANAVAAVAAAELDDAALDGDDAPAPAAAARASSSKGVTPATLSAAAAEREKVTGAAAHARAGELRAVQATAASQALFAKLSADVVHMLKQYIKAVLTKHGVLREAAIVEHLLKQAQANRDKSFMQLLQDVQRVAGVDTSMKMPELARHAPLRNALKSVVIVVLSEIAIRMAGANSELLILRSRDASIDKVRHVVVRILATKAADSFLRKKDVQELVKAELGAELDDSTYKKVMDEFGTGPSGKWMMKDGFGDAAFKLQSAEEAAAEAAR